jgi:hypothetical protein
MSQRTITHEAFCKAYFNSHRRDETFVWEELDEFGKQWWEAQARSMWKELEPKDEA